MKKLGVDALNITGGGAYRYGDEISQKLTVPPLLTLTQVTLPLVMIVSRFMFESWMRCKR